MHNIVLFVQLIINNAIHLLPGLHVFCDLTAINNDRKHAILIIFMSVFWGHFLGGLEKFYSYTEKNQQHKALKKIKQNKGKFCTANNYKQ